MHDHAWLFLSLGIVILMIMKARDVGLLITQWIVLVIASVLVAGLCIWIVTWEDSDEAEVNAIIGDPASPKTPVAKAEDPKTASAKE
jgi:hypothetical protein